MTEKNQFQAAVVREIVVWVEDNINERITIDMASEFAGYSKWYIQKLFKKHCDYSLGEYIRLRRLNKATALLHLTRLPVYQIADLLGFDSHQTFHKVFVRLFGMTPAVYRMTGDWPAKVHIPDLRRHFSLSYKPLLKTLEARSFRGQAMTVSTDLDHPGSDFNRTRLYSALGLDDLTDERTLLISAARDADSNRVLSVEIVLAESRTDPDRLHNTVQKTLSAGLFLELKATLALSLIDSWVEFNYSYTLPGMGLSRREGVDLEYVQEKTTVHEKDRQVNIRYLIPVKF